MSFSGADVDELRALATRFDHQAARLRELAGSSSAAIMTAAWSGAKIDDVRSEWNRTSKPKILAVAAAFAGLATDLRRQAGEQSAASGGSLGGMTRLDIPDLPWPFTFLNPNTIPGTIGPLPWRIPDFGEFFPQLIAVGGMIPDGIEFIEALGRGGSLNGLTSVVDDIATFKPAAFLSLIGMGFSAHDLGVALAEGDEAGTFEASLDLIAGGLGFFVPGAGVAWEAGKLIGETGYNAVQPFWNTTDSM